MRGLVALAFIAILSGCICESPDEDLGNSTTTVEVSTTLKFEEPKDNESCEALGGIWGRMGLSPSESCNLPTSDAGKTCSDNSECEGMCIAELSPLNQARLGKGEYVKAKGKCSERRKNVGCLAMVQEGEVRGMLCMSAGQETALRDTAVKRQYKGRLIC
ncbi:MAG: hypothetical protein NTU61_04855 [Candidatus Altiarchaeota archaeon]|nr:hypothetical protein [Candidatus Altiarchaeota archaeon]